MPVNLSCVCKIIAGLSSGLFLTIYRITRPVKIKVILVD